MRRRGFILPVLVSFLSLPLAAQAPGNNEGEPSIDPLLKLMEIPVISASKTLQAPIDAPAKVVVVSKEEIQLRGYMDLEEVLHDLPGFDFNKVMGVEWSTVFMRGYRSQNSDRFLLIWDGIVQNDIWKQNANISRQYPLVNVQRIEVLYGPASLLYGPNAFNGIINVILKTEEESSGVSGRVSMGSFQAGLAEVHVAKDSGTWRAHLTVRNFTGNEDHLDGKYWVDQGGQNRYYSLRFRPGRSDNDFLEPGPGNPDYALDVQDGILYYRRMGQRVPFQEGFSHDSKDWFVQAGLGWKELDLRIQSWKFLEDQGAWHTPQNLIDAQRELTGNAVYLVWKHSLSKALDMESQLAMRTSGEFDQDGTPRPKAYFTNSITNPRELKVYAISDTAAKVFAREYRASQLFTHQEKDLDIAFGWDYTVSLQTENYSLYSVPTNTFIPSTSHDERNVGLFGNIQARVTPWLSLSGGLRRDYNYVAGEKGGFGHLSTPRLVAIFTISPAHYVKVIQGDSFQTPPTQQKFSVSPGVRDIASPDLQPERLKSFELMYGFHPSARWHSTLNLYENTIDNFITSVSVPFGSGTTTKFVNRGSLRVQGAELESQFSFLDSAKLFLNATALSAKDPSTGRKTGDIAPLKANLGLDFRAEHWAMNLRCHYVSERDTVNWDSKSIYVVQRVGGYITFDACFSALSLWKGLDLRLNAYNLLNRQYYDPGPRSADGKTYNGIILQQPRRILLSLVWKF